MSQVRVRGIVEGFYGPLYSFAERRALFQFLATAGMNAYIYAPKLDPYHRDEWRSPYPPDYLAHFHDLAELGSEIGVRFIFAISPGLTFDPATDDPEILEAKLQSIFAVGVRDFCLFFDDIETGQPGADPEVQTDLVIHIRAFLRGLDAGTSLTFISNFYSGTAAQIAEDRTAFARLFGVGSSEYYAAYRRIPADVAIMWTGPAVFSDRITIADASDLQSYVGRPIWVWDNYPVNDALVSNELFLGPYEGREAGLGSALDGILVNPMLQAEATKIPLWTIGRYFRDGAVYDPDTALEDAIERVAGEEGSDVVRLIAQQFRSHPFIGEEGESAALGGAIDAYWNNRSAGAEVELRAIFAQLSAVLDRLDTELTNRALADELREPAIKLALLGEAGGLALDLLAAHARGEVVDVTALTATLEQAATIRWLVGANTALPPALAGLVASREGRPADVFGDFFARVGTELAL